MHLLGLNNLTEKQILDIFCFTNQLKRTKNKNILNGKTFILFFPETSIRTRITFEKGIKDLGGECILFPPETLDKREDLSDVVQYIDNWADGIIVRHSDFSKVEELSKHTLIPVINAMTSENHPCEILSDLYSISEIREGYRNLVYSFVGTANNISKSWMEIAKVMDLKFRHVCTTDNRLSTNNQNYTFSTDLETTLVGSDVILTDSLPDDYRKDEYIEKYQITLGRMELANKGAFINPCPPFFRNEEVSEEVISSQYFVGYSFKKNLIYVQQAVILYCLGLFKEGADIL
jgi:ornithine carbamoyltransferase